MSTSCKTCDGSGWATYQVAVDGSVNAPCPECRGTDDELRADYYDDYADVSEAA